MSSAVVVPPRPTSPTSHPAAKGELRYTADGTVTRWDGRDWVPAVVVDARPGWKFSGGSGQQYLATTSTLYAPSATVIRAGVHRANPDDCTVVVDRAGIYLVHYSVRLGAAAVGETRMIIERQSAAGIRIERAEMPLTLYATLSRTFWCAAGEQLVAAIVPANDITSSDAFGSLSFEGLLLSL